jgi:hypothetical protein
MSERFEFIAAERCPVELVGPGTELGEDEVDGWHHALVIGDSWSSALVVEGTRRELCAFVDLLAARLGQDGGADGVGSAAAPPAGGSAAPIAVALPTPATGGAGQGSEHQRYVVI